MIRVGERLETLAQSGSIFTNGLGLLYYQSRAIAAPVNYLDNSLRSLTQPTEIMTIFL